MGFCCRWAFPTLGDDRAERNLGVASCSTQHGHPSGWKRPSTTEPHIRFLYYINTELHEHSLLKMPSMPLVPNYKKIEESLFWLTDKNTVISQQGDLTDIVFVAHLESQLTLVLLNKLSLPHPFLTVNQSDNSMLFVTSIHKLNEKQCRSWSDGFWRSHLIWIYTVFKENAYPGSAGQGLITNVQWFPSVDTSGDNSGRRCEPEGCNIIDNCDINAQCIPDPRDTSRYMCRCNPGFEGDGTVCLRRGKGQHIFFPTVPFFPP